MPIHNRRSIRLPHYDYSQKGIYFVTICTHAKKNLFDDIVANHMCLNTAGNSTANCWLVIPIHYPFVHLGDFVVMTNHIHGIIVININSDSPLQITETYWPIGTSKTLGAVVPGFKIGVTKWFRKNTDIYTVWQRNYYEHIVRSDQSLEKINYYIKSNPQNWKEDEMYIDTGKNIYS